MKKLSRNLVLILLTMLLTSCCWLSGVEPAIFSPANEILPIAKVNQPYYQEIIVNGTVNRVVSATENDDTDLKIDISSKEFNNEHVHIISISGTPTKVTEYQLGFTGFRFGTMTCTGDEFVKGYVLRVTE